MKNWKYINGAEDVKIGNEKVDNIKQDEKAKKLYDEMMDAKEIAEEWAKSIHSQPKDNLENGRKAAEEAYRKAKRAYEEYAMNSKAGNDTLAEYSKRPPKVVGGNSLPEELEKDVEKKDKEKVDDIEELKKTGNRQKYDTGDEVTVTLPGRGPRRALVVRDEGNVIKVAFSENGPEVTALPSEVSNKKVGNSIYSELNKSDKRVVIEADGSWYVYDKNDKVIEQGRESNADNALGKFKAKGYNKKVGNSEDDKFAYVMREFEEGKLKTPDGKVVTDPAQAKAIAYSESKKTENGLTRARSAMAKNKKVKNSVVREYKHSDGRVAQIDFNEDGSDADMSIYEGSKEIEQRNFSTIRDAEQYVTSHGFRRI